MTFRKQLDSNGFSALEVLVVVMIASFIIIVGLIVVIVGKSSPSKPKTNQAPASTVLSGAYAGWDTYTNHAAELIFHYPASWQSQVSVTTPYSNGSFAGISGTLTAPDNQTLYWVYDEIGGKGDATCAPGLSDVPFMKTDTCASKQTYKVDRIASATPTPNSVGSNLFEDRLYITETRFYQPGTTSDPVSGRTGKHVIYQICLDPYYNPNSANGVNTTPIPVVGIVMGPEEPCEWSGTGFNVTFPVASEADFNSSDAKTALLIMKSFDSVGN